MATLLEEGFAIQDDCRFTFLPRAVVLEGQVVCLGSVTLEVSKQLEILTGRGVAAMVQTRSFSYHAWVRGRYNIFRYDSAHDHRRFPHKHIYDTFGFGKELDVTELTSEDDVPTLTEVIRELRDWYQANAGRLRDLE